MIKDKDRKDLWKHAMLVTCPIGHNHIVLKQHPVNQKGYLRCPHCMAIKLDWWMPYVGVI